MTDRQDFEVLERKLLEDPFDADARADYARALQSAERCEEALAQWNLVLRQGGTHADPHLSAAACAQRIGDEDAAAHHLSAARECDDFEASDPRIAILEAPDEATRSADVAPSDSADGRAPTGSEEEHARLRLHAIEGGRPDAADAADVISITRAEKVRFEDVVGMHDLKKIVRLRIIEPFLRPGLFQRFKKKSGGGVMLYGPPGCGKTMIARAIATECEAAFTPIGISDILNMFIGESERNLAAIFEKAREEAPAVLFFDELDALAFARSKAHSEHRRSLVNEFLNQLDGMSGANEKVLILAATNMPWDVDDAMKRPGRFDRQIFVPPPDADARAEMLRVKLRDVPTDPIDADSLAIACKHFSGADMDGLIEYAKDDVLAEILDGAAERNLTQDDLVAAVDRVEPSTLEWLKTARNLVKFGGGSRGYKDVEKYLRSSDLY